MVGGVALGRIAEPAEVASAIAFLASADASYVTGAACTSTVGSPPAVRADPSVSRAWQNWGVTTIAALEPTDRSLKVRWVDGGETEFPWLWLRDHDAATLHPVTQQRQLFTAGVSTELRGSGVAVVDDAVQVTWNDGSEPSTLASDFLARFRTPAPARIAVAAERVLWDRETITDEWPTVSYADVMAGDDGVVGVDAAGVDLRLLHRHRHTAHDRGDTRARRPRGVRARDDLRRLLGLPGEPRQGRHGLHEHRTAPPHRRHLLARRARPPAAALPRVRRRGRPVHDGRRVPHRGRAARCRTPSSTTCSRGCRCRASTSATVRTSWPAGPCSVTTSPASWCRCRSTTPTAPRSCCRPTRWSSSTKRSARSRRSPTTTGCSGGASTRPATRCCSTTGGCCTGAPSYTGHRHLCGAYVNREDYESRLRLALAAH